MSEQQTINFDLSLEYDKDEYHFLINFLEYTEPMTDREMQLINPYFDYLVNHAYGKDNIKLAGEIAEHLKRWNNYHNLGLKSIDNVLIGKMTHHMRASGKIPNLIATSKGYFLSDNVDEIKEGIESLHQRARSIKFAADNMLRGMGEGNMFVKDHTIKDFKSVSRFSTKHIKEKKMWEYINILKPFDINRNYRNETRTNKFRENIRDLYNNDLTDRELEDACGSELHDMIEYFDNSELFINIDKDIVMSIRNVMKGIIKVSLLNDRETSKKLAFIYSLCNKAIHNK